MQAMLPMEMVYAALAAAGNLFTAFAQAAAPVTVAALWQGAAIALVLFLSLRLAPRIPAAHRFTALAAGFAAVAGISFLPLLAHFIPGPHFIAAGAQAASALPEAAAKPWLELDSRWGLAIAALWLAVSALRAASLGIHTLRARKLWKTAIVVEVDAGLCSLLAAAFPSRRAAKICTTQELDRPGVIGFFAPRILIPEWLFSQLAPAELEHVILHEAEHLRRRDDWTNLFEKLFLVLFPLNPALLWLERRLSKEREMACDEAVVGRTHAPRAYAACLASMAERRIERRELLRRTEALSLGAFERQSELVRRVHSILWSKQALPPLAARAVVGAVGCGLLIASAGLARCPQAIAFVSAPRPEAALAQSHAGSASFERAAFSPVSGLARAHSGFRAIETRTALPASRYATAPLSSVSPRLAAEPADAEPERKIVSRDVAASAPRQEFAKAELPSSAAPAQEQQLIVFTAWEEVQTPAQNSRKVAGYDAGEPAQRQTAGAANRADAQPPVRITFTRMILAIYPANSAPFSAPGSQKAPGLKSPRPAPLPIDSGWLVFQL